MNTFTQIYDANDKADMSSTTIEVTEGEGEGWSGLLEEFLSDNAFDNDYADSIRNAINEQGKFSDLEIWGRWTIERQ
jgi:hypothetical protein